MREMAQKHIDSNKGLELADCRAETRNEDLICSLRPGLCDHGDFFTVFERSSNLEMKDLP